MSRHHARSLWRLPPGATADEALDRLGVAGERQRHAFVPHGTSATLIAPELTLAVHTWPEHGLATLDRYGELPPDAERRLVAAGWSPLPEDPR
ncbi:MAG: S-adenosylmethionine decarboxylase [Alphaproteobacteria bacterium]|nr:S-adenosylmethionine decarboxylase [Alphaproteobacteria bacterium]